MRTLLCLLLILILGACSTYSDEDLKGFDKTIREWIRQQNIQYKSTDSGLYYYFENKGQGQKIKYTDSVTVQFKGTLLDSTIFEIEKAPVTFAVNEVIIAWKEVLLMSERNAKIKIIVPPQLGYGNHKLDKIPQNSILLYEIEIIDIK
tara:strand:+ start:1343 stop:1786 length:444 start_codon:yes stop_codon:yes gene_type:complete